MSSLPHSLVNWQEFLRLPERPETGQRYELHDGEVVLVPPARPLHIKLQKRLERLIEARAAGHGVVTIEFPYRPVPNLQYWFADVAYIPQSDWDGMPPDEYPIYAPPLIIEVLSPSNSASKIQRQRIVALSAGTQEFWVVDAEKRLVHVTTLDGTLVYGAGSVIPLAMFASSLPVDEIVG